MKQLTAILLILAMFLLPLHGKEELKTLAHWDFSSENPLTSGTFPLKLRGSAKIENGALLSAEQDVRNSCGAEMKKNNPAITPKNAFSLTIDFTIGKELKRQSNSSAVLWDNKYVYSPNAKQVKMHKGMALWIKLIGADRCCFGAAFGYGDKSATCVSKVIPFSYDKRHSIKLYFSATGKVSFTLDGASIGEASAPIGSIAHSSYAVTLGDRRGSNFSSLGGYLHKVTLKEEEFIPTQLMADSYFRKVFERGEKGCAIHAQLYNFATAPQKDVRIHAETTAANFADKTISEIGSGEKANLSWDINSWLLPGKYDLNLTATDNTGRTIATAKITYAIVPQYGDFMPVGLWGGGTNEAVKEAGFTHKVINIYPTRGNFNPDRIPSLNKELDEMLEAGLYAYTSVYAKYRFLLNKKFLCKDRNGKVYAKEGLEASRPEVQEEFERVAEETSKAIGNHPAWDSTLINSEVRGTASPSFTGVQEANFKKFAGYEIPADIERATPPPYSGIAGFPWDRIINPAEPHFVYYNWFRKSGDGWNDTQTAVSRGIHKHMKHHHFTFHDPAVRVLPQWGSGGNVDVISQWTYTYPDPIKIGQATDELIAMADGNPGQRVMSMTQAIWYRSATAPKGEEVANPPAWLQYEKEAKFITIAPDFLREAIWSKVSRKIDGIMYHGSGSLLYKVEHSYRYTNPESKKVLAESVNKLIKPLGPTLKKIPEREPEIAILESATGWLFNSSHSTSGWSNGWAADLHLALQWAHMQPAILYEEHLLTDKKLGRLKVLFMPGAEVLTTPIKEKLAELQSKGVILVGDEYTAPGVMVDFRLTSIKRNNTTPRESKETFQKLGMEIAAMLKPYYTSPIDASNNDLVVRRRGDDAADYVFVLNDKRTFGDYVGQWGRVMEKGLPNSGRVTVSHSSAAAYDLVSHKKIQSDVRNGKTSFDVALSAGDGALILLLDKEIAAVNVELPAPQLQRGDAYSIKIDVINKDGNPAKAIIPIEVTMTDEAGTALPGSGFYSALNGTFTINETAAPNMAAGKVTIQVKELASGLTTQKSFMVK